MYLSSTLEIETVNEPLSISRLFTLKFCMFYIVLIFYIVTY